ncbi:MAG: DUF4129 domain-containing protein [Anaerolineales bacterium]|nr:DUF4129 domain-containing protein [Anaerolineales bacterium]
MRPWRLLAILALVLMELTWEVLWFLSLLPADLIIPRVRAFTVFGVILLAAYVFIRLVNTLRLRVIFRQVVMVGVLVAGTVLGIRFLLYPGGISEAGLFQYALLVFSRIGIRIPVEFFMFFVAFLLWWRGISLAGRIIGVQEVLGRFRLGFGMFLVFILVHTFDPIPGISGLIYLFLFAVLVAMIAARISTLRYHRGGQCGYFDLRWALGSLAATMVLIVLAVLAVGLVGQANRILLDITYILWNLAVLVVLIVSAPFVIILFVLFEWFLTRAHQSLQETILAIVENLTNVILATVDLLQSSFTTLMQQISDFLQRFNLDAWLGVFLRLRRYTLWLFLAGGIVFIFWIAGKKVFSERDSARVIDEERGSVEDVDDLLEILRKAILQRAQKAAEGLRRIGGLRSDRRLLAAARIRRIYAKLMLLCERLEAPRLEAQTPNEYLPTLKMLFPLHYAEVELLTDAYVRVRYGELPEGEQELRGIEAAWKRVREQGELVLKYNIE